MADSRSSHPSAPGGVPSAHQDTFARDLLPPLALQPVFDFTGVPELAAYGNYQNAATELLDNMVAGGFSDRPVLHYEDKSWTYGDLLTLSNQIARVLVEDCGMVTGARVLLRAANTPMLVACWFAVLKAGGICVTTMPLLRARELAYLIDRAGVTIALSDVELADELEEAAVNSHELRHLLYFTTMADGGPKATLETAMDGKKSDFPNVNTAADDIALIGFTSGTTGNPKGTVHYHRDLMAITDCFPRYVGKITPDDVITGTPPLAFTFGLGGVTLFPMRFGASTRFFPASGPEALFETIDKYHVTQTYTAPTAFRTMANLMKKYDLSSLRQGISAGETLPKATWEAFHEATGIRLIDGLGTTEMLHIFVSASPENMRPGFTGKAIPGYQARVTDADGTELAPGTPGFLAVKGPTGCRYMDDPRQANYVKDGWNYPGDVYEMDEQGYFKYVARADDMIISSGYNISGPEVENVLLEHASVAECAVIGAPDPERTNIVKAFIVLREGQDAGEALTQTLQDFVKSEIAPYKYPRAIEFVDALPKTATGKLQRFRLRQEEDQR
ncbi:MAG: AMP-binding protein [Rhodospirillales bacterium]|nr:AMP-binding protein [Rhodospirillales bacterium]